MSVEVDMAWAAGLFEGEGCINYSPVVGSPWGQRRRRLNLEMTDGDVVRRFASIVGAGNVRRSRRQNRVNRENHHTIYIWECGRWADTERILQAFLPYLGKRRRKKAEALLADPAGPVGRRKNAVDDETAEVIERLYGIGGLSQRAVAARVGIAQSTVSRVLNREDPGLLKIGKVL